jgi:hypothetical protein
VPDSCSLIDVVAPAASEVRFQMLNPAPRLFLASQRKKPANQPAMRRPAIYRVVKRRENQAARCLRWCCLWSSYLTPSAIADPHMFQAPSILHPHAARVWSLLSSDAASVFSSDEMSPEPSEVPVSDLSRSGGTNLHLMHVVLLQCLGKTLDAGKDVRAAPGVMLTEACSPDFNFLSIIEYSSRAAGGY